MNNDEVGIIIAFITMFAVLLILGVSVANNHNRIVVLEERVERLEEPRGACCPEGCKVCE